LDIEFELEVLLGLVSGRFGEGVGVWLFESLSVLGKKSHQDC
jgi:hypothetical protein